MIRARAILSYGAVVVILALPLVWRPFSIGGISMYPTLRHGDVVLLDLRSISIVPPRRGELLVFNNPHKLPGEHVDVKRVIGLPGETVHVHDLYIVITRACNEAGRRVAPAPSAEGSAGPCQATYGAGSVIGRGRNGKDMQMYLGPQDYFVMGDNRPDSIDSRSFGAVQPENFLGRVVMLAAPLSRITLPYGAIQ